MPILLESLYLPPIPYMSLLLRHDTLLLEQFSHYQKTSCRNRTYLASSQGILMLSIPLVKGKHERQIMKDVRISYNWDWQKLHWASLQTAYRSSPYFEFYEADFYPYYHQKYDFLIDYNTAILQTILALMKQKRVISQTESYLSDYSHIPDLIDSRSLVHCKPYLHSETPKELPNSVGNQQTYHQIFADRVGFWHHLSVLDLLFNEGNRATTYLLAE